MSDNAELSISWRGSIVGTFKPGPPDIWYRDGVFSPSNDMNSAAFEAVARALDYKAVYANWELGTRIVLEHNQDCLVMALTGDVLSIRIVVQSEARTWLLENVK
jgi:hypothetical protein